jgi:DNA-binding LacI/PurR family transcriptional regulator
MIASHPKQSSEQTVKHLYRSLKQLAREKGPDFKLPTTRDLCTKYGTNMVNVNNALRELEAQDLIYRRQGSGIYVSPNVNRTRIAVLLDYSFFSVPGISPFWGMLWGLLARESERRSREMSQDGSFHLVMPRDGDEDPLPEPLARAFDMEQIHGVIGIGLPERVQEWLMERDVPFVAFAGTAPLMVVGEAGTTIHLGVPELVKHGCRRIALLVPSEPHRAVTYTSANIDLFRTALAAHGVPCHEELLLDLLHQQSLHPPFLGSHGTHQKQGFDAVMQLFRGAVPPPDGMIITDDAMTNGAVTALNSLGVRLWDDIKIVSHMNIGSPLLFHCEKKIIGTAIDPSEIVAALYELLDHRLDEDVRTGEIVIGGRLMLPEL